MEGLSATFGSGAMTNHIHDLKQARCIVAIGTNTTEAHPVIAATIKQAVRNGTKLIVINPRRISLSELAHIWLRPHPGTNVALVMGMARVIMDEGLQDSAFINERCENFEDFRVSLAGFDLREVSDITGVPAEDIKRAARLYAGARPATTIYAMGVAEHSYGTDGVMALSNLALLTGNVGRPGAGLDPLRGQNNVQGACDMGCLPNVYPGYQRVDNPDARTKFENAWGRALPSRPGFTLTKMIDEACSGNLKAIHLIGENPVLSDPNQNHTISALKRLDLLVVQDIFLTETARLAQVVLPAASFAEKDGTFTNTERRIQRIRQAVPSPGEAHPDWEILCDLAKRMGAPGFNFANPGEVMDEISRLTPIYGGVGFGYLENNSLQWPCPNPGHPGTPILHTESFSRGRGKFIPLDYAPPAETPDETYPFVLTSGRSLYHYHTGTMTRKVSALNKHSGEGKLEINPADAARLDLVEGDWVKVSSRRGELRTRIIITDVNPPGLVYLNFHFTEVPTNALTGAAHDQRTGTPDYKVTAVKVEKSA